MHRESVCSRKSARDTRRRAGSLQNPAFHKYGHNGGKYLNVQKIRLGGYGGLQFCPIFGGKIHFRPESAAKQSENTAGPGCRFFPVRFRCIRGKQDRPVFPFPKTGCLPRKIVRDTGTAGKLLCEKGRKPVKRFPQRRRIPPVRGTDYPPGV